LLGLSGFDLNARAQQVYVYSARTLPHWQCFNPSRLFVWAGVGDANATLSVTIVLKIIFN